MTELPPFIAVIDDDESMCQALSRLLRVTGYHVRTYFSAESFLDDPDHDHSGFVVADIQLRGMSGFDLQRRIVLEMPALPFAFITAHDEAESRAQAKASGCVAYLRKPFPGSALLDTIKRHWRSSSLTGCPLPISADNKQKTNQSKMQQT